MKLNLSIMRFLEYLFFKYYQLQLRVGNKKKPSVSAITALSAVFLLYYADIVLLSFLIFSIRSQNAYLMIGMILIPSFATLAFLHYLFVYHDKGDAIVSKHEQEWKKQKNWGVILFSILPLILLVLEMLYMYLENSGKI